MVSLPHDSRVIIFETKSHLRTMATERSDANDMEYAGLGFSECMSIVCNIVVNVVKDVIRKPAQSEASKIFIH